MADFKENLYVSQYEGGYSYYWEQIDLVTLDSVKAEYKEDLNILEIIEVCKNKGFDYERVLKYFGNRTGNCTIHLTDEY